MKAKYIKSRSLLVPIISHDERNYLTAPPIHQLVKVVNRMYKRLTIEYEVLWCYCIRNLSMMDQVNL